MGIFLVIGMMLYSVGLSLILQRFARRAAGVHPMEHGLSHPAVRVVVPDRVPAEWVDAYRAEHGG